MRTLKPVLLALFLSLATVASAQNNNPTEEQVRALVQQLGDQSFSKREAARKSLLTLGDKLIPGYGYVTPDDVNAFSKDRTGFVDVRIRLTPSRTQALSDPAITRYFPGTITSDVLRMKIVDLGENKRASRKW